MIVKLLEVENKKTIDVLMYEQDAADVLFKNKAHDCEADTYSISRKLTINICGYSLNRILQKSKYRRPGVAQESIDPLLISSFLKKSYLESKRNIKKGNRIQTLPLILIDQIIDE